MAKITGLENIEGRILKAKEAMYQWKDKFIEKSATKLYEKIQERAGVVDIHTPAVLEDMGHPYAKRDPRNPHFPPYIVHKQSGDLFRAIKRPKYKQTETTSEARVEIDEEELVFDYARDVLFGSSVMIGRNFLSGSLEEIKKEVISDAKESLKKTVQGLRR